MKKFCKIFFVLILCLSLFGCQKKQEISPRQSLESLIGLIVFQSTASIETIGMKQEEGQEILDDIKEEAISTLEDTFKSLGLNITTENVEEIFEAQSNALKNATLHIEENEEDLKSKKEVRTLKISTNVLPISETLLTSSNKILQKLEADEIKDEEQFNEIFINEILEGLNNVFPSEETVSFEVSCVKNTININGKEAEIWLPENMEKFAEDLINYIQE